LALVKEQTEIFLLDNDALLNKGNKAAKRARVASLKAGKAAKQYRAESMRVHAQQLKDFDIILI
jgi:hypothetical protein